MKTIAYVLFSVGIGFAAASFSAPAVEDGSSVVVVYNRKLDESRQVAEYYAQRRGVPAGQLFGFELPTGEVMSRVEYQRQLQEPLLEALEKGKLFTFAEGEQGKRQLPVAAAIRYAVLCYGVPLKIQRDDSLNEPEAGKLVEGLRRNEAAVDHELACLPMSATNYLRAGIQPNVHYRTTNAAVLHPTNGLLLVTRLDGPTAAIARGLVDKAIEAETNGLWGKAYFDLRNTTNADYVLGDKWLLGAAQICFRLGYETEAETNETTFRAGFPMNHVALYAGWYDGEVSGPFARPAMEFMPGAFAYHLHSFSAQSIRTASRHWVGPLLARGATATMGCVNEPYLGGTPDVATFMACFLGMGFSFGEAAYACQAGLSWQTTVVGDPLYRPANVRPQDRHKDLEARHSPLLEWSHLKVVNLNLTTGTRPEDLIAYLEQQTITRKSAVLTEKLANLYWMTKQYSDGLELTEAALKRGPSPQLKVSLMLSLAERLKSLGRDERQFEVLESFVKQTPDYPEMTRIYQRLAALARKLNNQEAAAKYEALVAPAPK